MRYRLTERADDDVIEIFVSGVREFGERQAARYHAALVEAFEFVAAHPLAARERKEYVPPVRMHFIGAHVVAYVVDEDHVLIVRVLHGRQDWERHLT
jgi:toxin ParE1/3/4